jgi:hypothetical protein
MSMPDPSRRRLPVAVAPDPSPPDTLDGRWLATPAALAPYRDATAPTRGMARDAWYVAEALFATEAGPPAPARLGWLVAELSDFLARIGSRARWSFRLAMWALVWFAPLRIGRLPPLARLSRAERLDALERLERAGMPQAAAIFAVKAVLCILYFEHPEAAAEIGFDGRCKGEES